MFWVRGQSALSVVSPTPSLEHRAVGGVSSGWAGGYCVPPKGDKRGTTGWSPLHWQSVGSVGHLPSKCGWELKTNVGGWKLGRWSWWVGGDEQGMSLG